MPDLKENEFHEEASLLASWSAISAESWGVIQHYLSKCIPGVTKTFIFSTINNATPPVYDAFFWGLSDQLKSRKASLATLTLDPCTLEVLNAFTNSTIALHVKQLEIRFSPDIKWEDLAPVLDALLVKNQNSKNLFKSLVLKNLPSNAVLEQFVENYSSVINISLPQEHPNPFHQRILDRAASTNLFKATNPQKDEKKEEPEEKQLTPEVSKPEKRTRPRPKGGLQDILNTVTVDVELQDQKAIAQQQQVDNQQQQEVDFQNERESHAYNEEFVADFFNTGDSSIFYNNTNYFPPLVYLSQNQLSNLWDIWFGHCNNNKNRYPGMVSRAACEQLLTYRRQLVGGFELNYLPAGFRVHKKGNKNNLGCETSSDGLLHFDPELAQETQDLLAPVLKEAPKPLPLAYPLVQKSLEYLRKKPNSPIIKIWQFLEQSSYSRETEQLFWTCLPELMHYNDEKLDEYFFSSQVTILSIKQKLRLLQDSQLISDAFKPHNVHTELTRCAFNTLVRDKKVYNNSFVLKTEVSSFLTFYYSRKQPNALANTNNLLYQLLEPNDPLRLRLIQWGQKIPCLSHDALLQVYSQCGRPGLEALLNRWDNTNFEILQHLHQHLFQHAKSYVPLLDDELTQAIDKVRSLSDAQRLWWNRLLEKHGQHVGYDHLPSLINTFKRFVEIIELKQLDFYELKTNSFGVSQSLPVSIARMVTILEQCNPQNRLLQWQCLHKLSLASSGAVRMIQDHMPLRGERTPCQFIVPEMEVNTAHNHERNGYDDDSSPEHALALFKNISSRATWDRVKQSFFRRLAVQSHLLPLAFYYNALTEIEKSGFGAEEKKQLVALLFASTTGEQNLSFLVASGKDPLAQWKTLLLTLKNEMRAGPASSRIRARVIANIHYWTSPPSLPVLNKLLLFIVSRPKKTELNRLNKACNNLSSITYQTGNAIYDGMRFYDEEYAEHEKTNKNPMFYSLVDATEKYLKDVYRGNAHVPDNYKRGDFRHLPREYSRNTVCLIGIFQFQPNEQLADLRSSLTEMDGYALNISIKNKDSKPTLVTEILSLLVQITNNKKADNSKLNPTDLIEVFTALNKSLKPHSDRATIEKANTRPDITLIRTETISIIKEKLKAHFSPQFFDRLNATYINEQLQVAVAQSFLIPDEAAAVCRIISRIDSTIQTACYQTIIQSLSTITSPMKERDKQRFLRYLNEEKLYTRLIPIQEMQAFLDLIVQDNRLNDFLYLMDKAQHTPQLSLEKIFFYLGELLPSLEKKHAQSSSKAAILQLAISMFLKDKTTADQFNAAVPQVDRSKDPQSKALETLLDEAKGEEKVSEVTENALKEKMRAYRDTYLIADRAFDQLLQPLPSLELEVKEATGPIALVAAAGETVKKAFAVAEKFGKGIANRFKAALYPKPAKSEPVPPVPVKAAASEIKEEKGQENVCFTDQAIPILEKEKERLSGFHGVFSALLDYVEQMTCAYPGSRQLILSFFEQYAKTYTSLEQAWKDMTLLQAAFAELVTKDSNEGYGEEVIRSLCFHFSKTEAGAPTPQDLLALIRFFDAVRDNKAALEFHNYKKASAHQGLLLKIVSQLLNNEKFNRTDFQILIEIFESSNYLELLAKFYETPPFPSMKTIQAWYIENKWGETSKLLQERYDKFNLKPCERSSGGFSQAAAQRKLEEFANQSKLGPCLDLLSNQIEKYKTESTRDLIDQYQNYRIRFQQDDTPTSADLVQLLALSAELLYRCKSKEGQEEKGAYELNTTQYLSLLSILLSGKHNLHEIGTGEGKSRITAVLTACLAGLDKTVDMVTSDISLATRDYFEFQPYYQMLKVPTGLIYSDSPITEYRMNGINYSDVGNLSLYRNFARSTGQEDKVLNPNKAKRGLAGDEGDKLLYDLSQTQYNSSAQADPNLIGMDWIYPMLMRFFASRTDLTDLYFDDVVQHNAEFYNYVICSPGLSDDQLTKFKGIGIPQIEIWLTSAFQARLLVQHVHFAVEKEKESRTNQGPELVSEAQVLINKLKSPTSKFSSGMHQCLHAHLNLLKQTHLSPDPHELSMIRPIERGLAKELQDYPYDFHIDPEKQIVYTSSARSFAADYDKGIMLLLTGSQGSVAQKREAKKLYQMEFVKVPRHLGLFRNDEPTRITRNAQRQHEVMVDYIKAYQKAGRPVLIICEDDEQSQQTHAQLIAAFARSNHPPDLSLVDNSLSPNERDKRIAEAGQAGNVTISSLLGRGTDIRLAPGVNEAGGLAVLVTYLPEDRRDLTQFLGRAARQGQNGSGRLLLNKEDLKQTFDTPTLRDGFYTNPETYLQKKQVLKEKELLAIRIVQNINHVFKRDLEVDFFSKYPQSEPQNVPLKAKWAEFLREYNEAWKKAWPDIQRTLDPLVISELQNRLIEYRDKKIAILWRCFSDALRDKENNHKLGALPELQLKDLSILKYGKDEQISSKVYKKYDPAHAGLAAVYTTPLAEFWATITLQREIFANFRAWWRGEGILFPNLRAWWRGEGSFLQFAFNYDPLRSKTIAEPESEAEFEPEEQLDVENDRGLAADKPSSHQDESKEDDQPRSRVADGDNGPSTPGLS